MHGTPALAIAFGFCALSACGGGMGGDMNGGSGDTSGNALVAGTVVARDGSTSNLAGMVVSCPETGAMAMTDAMGSFDLAAPAGRPFSVEVSDPLGPQAGPMDGDCPEPGDDSQDATDISGSTVRVSETLGAGEVFDLEIVVAGGAIVQAWAGDDTAGPATGEAVLVGDGVMGEFEVAGGGMCTYAEIEVDGFAGAQVLTVALVDAQGQSAFLATLPVGADGQGHVSVHDCMSALPFGADSFEDLAGYGIEVRDESGAVVLTGAVPFVGAGHHAGSGMMSGGTNGGGMMGGGTSGGGMMGGGGPMNHG